MMFSVACHLARLIALKSSMTEIRLDAMKYVHFQTGAIPKTAAARGGGRGKKFWSSLRNGQFLKLALDMTSVTVMVKALMVMLITACHLATRPFFLRKLFPSHVFCK